MAQRYAISDLVRVGMLEEITTPGELETSAPYEVLTTTGITPTIDGTTVTDPSITGAGEVLDVQTTGREPALTTPAMLRFNDCRPIIGPALRSLYATPVAIVGAANISVDNAGTHQDGSIGPQIIAVGSTTAFNDLINYGGASANGAEGLAYKASGFADDENNWQRRIKAVYVDGADSKIDIMPGYVGGAPGFFGEPMVNASGESPTINVGTTVRNQVTGPGVKCYSALWQYTDMQVNGRFAAHSGLVAANLSHSWTGREGVTVSADWVGQRHYALTGTDPSGQGFVDNQLYTQMLTAADPLKHFAIVTDMTPIVLSQQFMNGFDFTVEGNTSAITDTSGTSFSTGVTQGSHVPSGSIDYYLVDDPRSEQLANIGNQGTSEKGVIDWCFEDRDGNQSLWACLWNEFGPTTPSPGAINNQVGGSITFAGQQLTRTSRTILNQEIPAV